jgi:ribosomal protein L40E
VDAPMDATSSAVRFGDWIAEGWRMFVEQWKGWVVNILVVLLVLLAPTVPYLIIFFGLMAAAADSRTAELPLLIWPLTFVFALVVSFVAMVMAGGLYTSALNQLRGGRVSPRDLLSAWDSFPQLLGAAILMAILTMIGAMLCIIPAYIVHGALFFTIPLILDRKLGVIEAMQTSFELTKKNILMFTLFAFVTGLIASIGTYACYIGLLATYPLQFTIGVVAYRDCFGVPGARAFLPAQQASPAVYSAPQVRTPVAPESVVQSVCPTCQASVPSTATYCPRCGRSMGT